jgi:hypothetical protein
MPESQRNSWRDPLLPLALRFSASNATEGATVKSRTFTCIGNNLTPWTGDAGLGGRVIRKNASSSSSNTQLHEV